MLAGLAGAPAAAVSAEALAALQPLASVQPDALRTCWPRLRGILLAHLEASHLTGELGDLAGEV